MEQPSTEKDRKSMNRVCVQLRVDAKKNTHPPNVRSA